jgi:hypothetical protein
MAETHTPIEVAHRISGHSADCTCGHRDVMWSTPAGARTAYLEHVVEAVCEAASWGGSASVDYEENGD